MINLRKTGWLLLVAVLMLGLPAAAAGKTKTKTFGGSLAAPIPPGAPTTTKGVLYQPLNIKKQGKVKDINVRIRAAHSDTYDLVILLISPQGRVSTLFNSLGTGTYDDLGSGLNSCSGVPTRFDDSGSLAIAAGSNPFAGTFKPETPLSVFNRKDGLKGTWTLVVDDRSSIDSGTLGCFQMDVRYKPA